MSDTPQTDNLARGNHVVPTEFAQELERERNAARLSLKHALEAECMDCAALKAELEEWHDAAKHVDSDHPGEVHCGCVPVLRKQLTDARGEVARLAHWKAAQMQVEANWDAQSVADELGLPIGVSIRPEILPRIKALKAEVARLRELLEAIELDDATGRFTRNRIKKALAAVRETTKGAAK
jgi:hypothetical protein